MGDFLGLVPRARFFIVDQAFKNQQLSLSREYSIYTVYSISKFGDSRELGLTPVSAISFCYFAVRFAFGLFA